MSELTMPALGADMDDATLIEWHVRPGDSVQRGDVVAVVETQKGLIDVEIWESGVIDELRVQPGVKVPVGAVLATVRPGAGAAAPVAPAAPAPATAVPAAEGAAAAPAAPRAPAARAPGEPAPEGAGAAPMPPSRPPPPRRPAASPSARRLARELGVDLESVRGTGPHGAITRDDVTRAAAPRPPRAEPAPTAPSPPPASPAAGAMRQAIAAAMARSKREIPHYYLSLDIDVSRTLQWLEAENQRRPLSERILLAAALLRATSLAARAFPEMNGHYVDGAFRPHEHIHLGVGIALRQGGLVAPALHDADRASLGEIMARLADLVRRARGGGLRSSELTDSTITVTNLGDQGADSVFGIIYPPQVALVGFGKPRSRPWAEGGLLGVRPIVTVTLAADHRVSDGHTGARFLNAIAQKLQEPEKS